MMIIVEAAEHTAIDDQDGNIILTIDEITNRWQQYYMNIMEGHLEEYMISDNNNTSNKEEYDITVQEISEAIGNLKNGKSAGVDNVKVTRKNTI
ncbi:hypothetical protein QE152_g7249 [Popillia japonica]|uniref:Uncharacterized protein n=1 Tax=Popillia japonica TaxID=7064 RepID=A0AAW1MGD4_POPJA